MAEKTVTEYQRIDSARQKAQQEKAKRKIYPINKAQPAGEQKPVPKFLKEEVAATESRAKKIRALYNTIETLRKNELPSKESPKMVRQLSDKEWLKQMHAASRQLNALLKKDNAMERLSPSGQEAVTYGAPLINAAKKLYFSKDKKSGGKVKNYGYMGGGKVYGQPRKATYKAG